MIAPGNSVLQILLAMAFVIASGYAAGRIHQWYKHCLQREEAFRNGYNEASRSMFDMALNSRRTRSAAAQPGPRSRVGHAFINERHAARSAAADADADRRDPSEGAHRRHAVGLSRRRISASIEHRLGRRSSAA